MVVCFMRSEHKYWWTRFLKDHFHHVIIIADCDDFWLVVDPTTSHIDILRYYKAEFATIGDILDRPHVQVEVEPDIDRHNITFSLSLNTCVDTAKRLMGIKSARIITPYQLYRGLTYGHKSKRFNGPTVINERWCISSGSRTGTKSG